jgi:hypothetical protein
VSVRIVQHMRAQGYGAVWQGRRRPGELGGAGGRERARERRSAAHESAGARRCPAGSPLSRRAGDAGGRERATGPQGCILS